MLYIVSELVFVTAMACANLPPPAAAQLDAAPATTRLPAPPPDGETGLGSNLPEPGRAAAAERLAAARGGSGIASDTQLGGEVANNTVQQVHTGANHIDSGSFSGSVGLPVVIQNSGANVLIQNATVINLQFK